MVLTLGQVQSLDVFEYLLEGHLLDFKETKLVGLFDSFTAGKPPRSRPERYILCLHDCKAKNLRDLPTSECCTGQQLLI